MSACKVNNAAMNTAVTNIANISAQFKTLAEDFNKDFNAAIAEMEGEAKDALKKFVDNDVRNYIETSIPEAIKGMSDLLEANRSNFESVDKQIADSISGNN